MVRSRDPKCIVPLHSLIADQNVLQCVVERMSHMQLSCNIRRWHHRCKRFLAAVYLRVKIFIFTPFLIQFFFNLFWIVSFCQFFIHSASFTNSPAFLSSSLFFHIFKRKSPLHCCKGRNISAVPPFLSLLVL